MKFTISPRSITTLLVWIYLGVIGLNLLVIGLYFGGPLHGEKGLHVFNMFYVNVEQNIPTFYNTVLLLIAGMLLSYIYLSDQKRGDEKNYNWLILSLAFFFLSIDENITIHEFFATYIPQHFGVGGEGFLKYAWVLPYGIMALLFGIFHVKFLLALRRKIAFGFIVAGFIYVAGAVGMEMVGSKIDSVRGQDNLIYAFSATLEEVFEMGGVIIFIKVLLDYIRVELGDSYVPEVIK